MMNRPSLVLALVLFGCSREDECMSVRELDVCVVLPTGLVLHGTWPDRSASMLGEGGTLELIGPVDGPLWCGGSRMAHDPELGKLWWVDYPFDGTPATLHQLDLETNTRDWQRPLVYDGYSFGLWSASLLAHEGALYLGGRLTFVNASDSTEYISLLERIDESGDVVWTQIGHPGPGDAEPLGGVDTLVGTSTGISFLGYDYGTDSAAVSAATVDAQTGELLWSASVDSDNYSSVDLMSSDGESLYVLTGEYGSSAGNEVRYAQSDLRSITPLGEENWRVDEFVWSKFLHAQFTHAVSGGELVDLVLGRESWESPQRVHVTRRRPSDGSLVCARDLPEVTDLGNTGDIEARAVGDQLMLVVRLVEPEDETVYETVYLLLQPVE